MTLGHPLSRQPFHVHYCMVVWVDTRNLSTSAYETGEASKQTSGRGPQMKL